VRYGIEALIAVMNLNIVLSQSLLQVVFISNILDLLQLSLMILKTAKINEKKLISL